MKSDILHLTKILFALFLCGCAATTSNHDPLPDFLVGEWVSPDFKAPPNPAQEPRDGFILYLLANGQAGWIAEPEIGSRCTATYHPNTRTLILKNIPPPGEAGPGTTCEMKYDPSAKTLGIVKITPQPDGDNPTDDAKAKLRRHSKEVPPSAYKALGLR